MRAEIRKNLELTLQQLESELLITQEMRDQQLETAQELTWWQQVRVSLMDRMFGLEKSLDLQMKITADNLDNINQETNKVLETEKNIERIKARILAIDKQVAVEQTKRAERLQKERDMQAAAEAADRERRIQLISDDFTRELKLLELKHERELERAKEAGENIRVLEQLQFDELVALDLKYAEQKEELSKGLIDIDMDRLQTTLDNNREMLNKMIEDEKAAEAERVNIRRESAMALLNILKATDKDTEDEQRKAFRRNQQLAVAETAVSTYSAAQGAYASQMAIPTPDAPIRAAAAAAAAIVQGLARVR
jgi:hypothetical protein